MSVTSRVHRGLIYAGDTPLACDIVAEQTGPMQITIRAGSFTTTGQALIRPYDPATHDEMTVRGDAELLPDRKRVRVWLQGADGIPVDKATTYTLATDQVIDLTSDPLTPVAYDIDLISDGAQADVLVKRRRVGAEQYGDPPAGWTKVHELLFEFVLPAGTVDITAVDIYALSVKPGFPGTTTAMEWQTQTGGA